MADTGTAVPMSTVDELVPRVGLIGWPVEHSVSPAMMNAAFREVGLGWHYGLLPTPPTELEDRLRELVDNGYRGANVTVPHKQAVMPYLDQMADAARVIGAVNTIVVRQARLEGHNTDGNGFLAALQEAGHEPFGGRALVLGAGGAARAVVFGLASGGSSVTVYNRTESKATALVRDFRQAGLGAEVEAVPSGLGIADLDLREFNLLVNTTSVGMWPLTSASPWPAECRMPDHWTVFDVVYNPKETKMLREAQSAGAKTVGGLGMLVHQGALAFTLWTGLPAPLNGMRAATEQAFGHI